MLWICVSPALVTWFKFGCARCHGMECPLQMCMHRCEFDFKISHTAPWDLLFTNMQYCQNFRSFTLTFINTVWPITKAGDLRLESSCENADLWPELDLSAVRLLINRHHYGKGCILEDPYVNIQYLQYYLSIHPSIRSLPIINPFSRSQRSFLL